MYEYNISDRPNIAIEKILFDIEQKEREREEFLQYDDCERFDVDRKVKG